MAWRALVTLLVVMFGAGGAWARTVPVADVAGLARAMQAAQAGDEIVLADGVYPIAAKLQAQASGTEAAPIVVRAEHRWKAELRSSTLVAIEVTGSWWTFRDLDMRGVCPDDSACEHALHVTGAVQGFRLIGSRLADFNAHLKVNGFPRGEPPRGGLVEGNELFDTHPRRTGAPVTPVNIDHGVNWVVRGNLIRDFHKQGGDDVSYGAFVKGGAAGAVFERNVVLCARDDPRGGSRIGLSFGGGGMDAALCPPAWNAATPCSPEVSGSTMRNNIIASCSDAGIYLNKARDTRVLFNTLIRTKGIQFRFPDSTGEVRGNLTTWETVTRDGGSFRDGGGNLRALSSDLESWYRDPDAGDLRLKAAPAPLIGKGGSADGVATDYCGRRRSGTADSGALQSSLGDCATLPRE